MRFSAFGPTLSDWFPLLISFQMQQPDPVRRGGRTGRVPRPLSRNLQIPGSPVRMRTLQYVFLRDLTRSSSLSQHISMHGFDVPGV